MLKRLTGTLLTKVIPSTLIFLFHLSAVAQTAVPAVITSLAQPSNSVGYVTASGTITTSVNAEIGRWDTPYTTFPNPVPGQEPNGKSILTFNIDVNDGGLVSFRFALETYDVGRFDWLDVYLVEPNGNLVTIVDNHSRPGQWNGSFWQGSPQSQSINLGKWKNQQIQVVFSVEQDGWGDQTRALITNFTVDTCQVPPLTPITDPSVQSFENGNRVVTDPQFFKIPGMLSCLQNEVANRGGTSTLTSAYRPLEYQKHLREVYDGWNQIKGRREPECAALKAEYQQEFNNHGPFAHRPTPRISNHTRGLAIDLSIAGIPESQKDLAGDACGLFRFDKIGDKPHFSPKSGVTPFKLSGDESITENLSKEEILRRYQRVK